MFSRVRTYTIKAILTGLMSTVALSAMGDTPPVSSPTSPSWLSHPWSRALACASGALLGIGLTYGLYKIDRYKKAEKKKTSKKPQAHAQKTSKDPVEVRVMINMGLITAGLVTATRVLRWMNLISPQAMAQTQNTFIGVGSGAFLSYLYQQAINRANTRNSQDQFTPIKSNVTLDDYTKDDKVLNAILKEIAILTSNDLLESIKKRGAEPKKGMLFYGPPGTGKTYLVAAIAGSSDIPLINIKISEVLSKYWGDAEKTLVAIFEQARTIARNNPKKKCIIFFDEINALAKNRASGEEFDPNSSRLVNTLIQEIDGLESTNEIIVIGCTNIPDKIDSAILSRLGKPIEIPLPSEETRIKYIDKKLKEESLQYIHAGDAKERSALAIQVAKLMEGHDFRALADLMQTIIRDSEFYKKTCRALRATQTDIDGYELTDETIMRLECGLVDDKFIITRALKYSRRPLPAHVITSGEYEHKVSADRITQKALTLELLPLDG